MRYFACAVFLVFCVVVLLSMRGSSPSVYTTQAIARFRLDSRSFAASALALKTAISKLSNGNDTNRTNAIAALRVCRLEYKRIEFFMEYFFEYPVNLYNRAPVYEVEEPYMEYQAPVGLQYIETLLTENDAFEHKAELLDQCEVVYRSAADIPALLYDLKADDPQILESVRLELVRIMTLGITGYDAPVLKSGIGEAAVSLQAVSDNLNPLFSSSDDPVADRLSKGLDAAVAYLRAHGDFDTFDRLAFIKDYMQPVQRLLASFIALQNDSFNSHAVLNHDAPNLFSRDAIDIRQFSQRKDTLNEQLLASLGKKLFSETMLSGNGSRSCASCHKPEQFFTDGLVKSKSIDGRREVQRNAPTLYYAAYQHSQFYDGRATSLEEQIENVLLSPLEMDANIDTVLRRLNNDQGYRIQFNLLFPGKNSIDLAGIQTALAAYEQTLAPFSSRFDRYMAGDAAALNAQQRAGFNLFMGKAQCGTCHFAPLFNGLLPPFYEVSEVEVLGVPQRTRTGKKIADTDSGRYRFFPISFNNGAFKTTSVRNAAATAPYMHNGAFRTLEDVVAFYNKGGGKALGFPSDSQTLSDKPLHLSRREIKDIVAFLGSLTDEVASE